jgi:hypothetical protein
MVRHYAHSTEHRVRPKSTGLWPNFHRRSNHTDELRSARPVTCHAGHSTRHSIIECCQLCRIYVAGQNPRPFVPSDPLPQLMVFNNPDQETTVHAGGRLNLFPGRMGIGSAPDVYRGRIMLEVAFGYASSNFSASAVQRNLTESFIATGTGI